MVSVAFIEVDPQRTTPSEYMKTVSGLEFDFIYLTPSADLTDHSAEIDKHLKTEKAEKTGER